MLLQRFISAVSRSSPACVQIRGIHVCTPSYAISKKTGLDYKKLLAPTYFVKQNNIMYPPLKPGEKPQAAWVCHERRQIRYSPKKMYHVARLIRGLSIDDAFKQLQFCRDKGAAIVHEILLEAQQLAVSENNIEFKSNLWVAESNVQRDLIMKGVRHHARMRFCTVMYRYCNYQVRLEEGPPPPYFYEKIPTGLEALDKWMKGQRARKIEHGV